MIMLKHTNEQGLDDVARMTKGKKVNNKKYLIRECYTKSQDEIAEMDTLGYRLATYAEAHAFQSTHPELVRQSFDLEWNCGFRFLFVHK
jgi:hypothetical protein